MLLFMREIELSEYSLFFFFFCYRQIDTVLNFVRFGTQYRTQNSTTITTENIIILSFIRAFSIVANPIVVRRMIASSVNDAKSQQILPSTDFWTILFSYRFDIFNCSR